MSRAVKGRYIKGLDRARYFMSIEPYKRLFREILGVDPYEGTLNIRTEGLSYRDLLSSCGNVVVVPDFMYDGRVLGGLYIWRGFVRGIGRVLVVRPFRSGHDEYVLEIVSDKKISSVLGLRPGDTLEVEIDC